MLQRIITKANTLLGWDQKGKPVSWCHFDRVHAVLIPELEVRQHCVLNQEISAVISNEKPVLFILVPELWYPFSSRYTVDNTLEDFLDYGSDQLNRNNINYGENVVAGIPGLVRDEMAEIKERLNDVKRGNLIKYSYDGIALGRLAATDLILQYKIHDLINLSDRHAQHFRDLILVAQVSFILTKHLKRIYAIDSAHAFNDYSPMSAFRLSLERYHVTYRTLSCASHKGADLSQFYFSKSWLGSFRRLKRQLWSEVKNLPLSDKGIKESFEDLSIKLYRKSAFAYSPSLTSSKHLPSRKDLLNNKSYLIAIYTSSLDEQIGSYYRSSAMGGQIPLFNDQLFSSQEAFLEWVVNNAEDLTQDAEIYIRIHPRSGSDQRNRETAQYLEFLVQLSKRCKCSSVHFVWPDDPLSSYYLGLQSDLCIVPWSSMVHELGRMGVPVLNLFIDHKSACQFPPDISLQAQTHEDIMRLINSPDAQGIRSRILNNHRFYVWRSLSGTLSVSDIRPASKYSRKLYSHFIDLDLQTTNYNRLLKYTSEIELEQHLMNDQPESIYCDYEIIISRLISLIKVIESDAGTPIYALERVLEARSGMEG